MRKFLEAAMLASTKGDLWVCSLRNSDGSGKGPAEVHVKTRDLDKIEKFAERWDGPGRGLFFCVGTIRPDEKTRRKSTAMESPLVHVDIDRPKDIEGTISKLLLLSEPPSAIVKSGHGVHAYWFLSSAMDASVEVEAVMKSLQKELKGDKIVAHGVALMRLPGSHNTKEGEWSEVTVEHLRPDWRYTLGQLSNPFTQYQPADQTDPEAELEAMEHGSVHDTQVRASASMLSRGMDPEEVIRAVLDATMALDGTSDWDWEREEQKVRNMCETWQNKLEREKKRPVRELPAMSRLEDFVAYLPDHKYIYKPTGDLWPAVSIDARLPKMRPEGGGKPIKASTWMDRHQAVEQMTWSPGDERIIEGRLALEGGWLDKPEAKAFNMYQAPPRDWKPGPVDPWRDHLRLLYPTDADHIERWLAHCVQRPGQKINHALLLGGEPGIGKDTILQPVRHAVGPWNWSEVTPAAMGNNNDYAQAVILRISELHDLGDKNRFSFYEMMKTMTAAPPDMLRINKKYVPQYYVPNVVGVIYTTNHKMDGLYLPPTDRRTYCAWSEVKSESLSEGYFQELWKYYSEGGLGYVASWLGEMDLSKFDAKAPPEKTPYFWEIIEATRGIEVQELASILDQMGCPAVTLDMILSWEHTSPILESYLKDLKNLRSLPMKMRDCGYEAVPNPSGASMGRWTVNGRRKSIYAKSALSYSDRIKAAQDLATRGDHLFKVGENVPE